MRSKCRYRYVPVSGELITYMTMILAVALPFKT